MPDSAPGADQPADPRVSAILGYLNQRGFQMASFERLRHVRGEELIDDDFRQRIKSNRALLRPAKLKGDKPGVAKAGALSARTPENHAEASARTRELLTGDF